MTLIKTTILNGVATLVRVATFIGLNKVLAVYVGPAGYALIGQFVNLVSVAGSLGGGAVGNGVTKYTAEFHDDETRQIAIWRIAARYLMLVSAMTSLAMWVYSEELSARFLGGTMYRPALVLLAVALPLMAFNSLLLAIMNGRKELRAYITQNISASISGALLSSCLAILFGLQGALAAIALNQAIVVLITLWVVRHAPWLRLRSFIGSADPRAARAIAGFVLMSLTTACVGPLSQILVRNHMMDNFGDVVAGEWQAVFKISEIYLLVFTTTLNIYYLPRISEIRDRADMWAEIRNVYRLVLPAAALAAGIIYVLREFITVALFTRDFLGMAQLFGWQLAGDVIKMGSWILGFIMVGRAMVRWFIFTEILFSGLWVVLTYLLTEPFGAQAASAAFALNYMLYWAFLIWVIRKELRQSDLK